LLEVKIIDEVLSFGFVDIVPKRIKIIAEK
jgi:hypothetical protein